MSCGAFPFPSYAPTCTLQRLCWEQGCKAKLPLSVLYPGHQSFHNYPCKSTAPHSAASNGLEGEIPVKHLRCFFFKPKKVPRLRQLGRLQEREECLALCHCRGTLPPCFGVKHILLSSSDSRSTKESTKPINFWSSC